MCLDDGNDCAFSHPHYQSVVHAQSNPAVEGVRTVVERTFRFSRAVQCHPRCRSLHRHHRFHTRTHGLSLEQANMHSSGPSEASTRTDSRRHCSRKSRPNNAVSLLLHVSFKPACCTHTLSTCHCVLSRLAAKLRGSNTASKTSHIADEPTNHSWRHAASLCAPALVGEADDTVERARRRIARIAPSPVLFMRGRKLPGRDVISGPPAAWRANQVRSEPGVGGVRGKGPSVTSVECPLLHYTLSRFPFLTSSFYANESFSFVLVVFITRHSRSFAFVLRSVLSVMTNGSRRLATPLKPRRCSRRHSR